LSENSSFTQVNFGFSDFTSLENEVFLSDTGLFLQGLFIFGLFMAHATTCLKYTQIWQYYTTNKTGQNTKIENHKNRNHIKENIIMKTAKRINSTSTENKNNDVVIGICAACDPRIDEDSRKRTVNIIEKVANYLAPKIKMPVDGEVKVVWSPTLIDGEPQADLVANEFKSESVDIIICTPDTWAFPQLSLMSLMAHFPKNTPLNITCGNSAPKPGVVFAHAVNGAFAQQGRLTHLNVGSWDDNGLNPQISEQTLLNLVDWCYAAVTYVGLKGKRVVCFGHDSMGMETALTHVNATRNTFGLEVTRLDMKLLADKLTKKDYNVSELQELRSWLGKNLKHIDTSLENGSEKLDQSLAMYLIIRDLLKELNAVGGAFMNQLEWGSDRRGIPYPICDMAESLFNSTFDHNGAKNPLPFGTEADMQGTLTMLFKTWLSGGNPPLFMDFRKVWEPSELRNKANEFGIRYKGDELWATTGIVDGDNSGSASLNWAGRPDETPEELLKKISMPAAELYYFPGGGNSVNFISPGGIEGIASRLTYSELNGMFSLIWDEAQTVDLPEKLADFVANSSNVTWPHSWIVPKYATMAEYKQYAPANHFHMTWGLKPAVLQYWMDLSNVLSVAPWQSRPKFIEGTDRPLPLLYLINGGENETKALLKRK
jgi:L-fucose/D-arabinose isomerase